MKRNQVVVIAPAGLEPAFCLGQTNFALRQNRCNPCGAGLASLRVLYKPLRFYYRHG